jgi:uncharacterized membrane protein YgdD (TMEM256/DUF423 family)
MNPRVPLAWAGALGATGVLLGAFGAHALRPTLEASGLRDVWETASRYQLVHAAALLGLAGWLRGDAGACGRWAGRCWAAGTLLFSGSLYLLALGGPRWLGPVTPLGGGALIAGWVLAGCAARTPRAER